MMLGQKATGADRHFRKIALAGEDWGRVTSHEAAATRRWKVRLALSREPGEHREETAGASDSRENTTFSSPRLTQDNGPRRVHLHLLSRRFTFTTDSYSDGGSPTTLSCPPAPRPPRRSSVPSPVVPAQCREARRRPSGVSPAAGPSPRSRCRVIMSTVPRRPLQAGTSSAATLRIPARGESGQASASAQGAKAHRGETLKSLHGALSPREKIHHHCVSIRC